LDTCILNGFVHLNPRPDKGWTSPKEISNIRFQINKEVTPNPRREAIATLPVFEVSRFRRISSWRQTEQWTDQRTNIVSYRGATLRLKIMIISYYKNIYKSKNPKNINHTSQFHTHLKGAVWGKTYP
jgi:hypothetical protein